VSSKSVTISLSSHLQKAQPQLYASLHEETIKKSPILNGIRSFRRKYPCKRGKFQDAVVRWLMEDSIPFREVETKAFRSYGRRDGWRRKRDRGIQNDQKWS